jgi:hypothetical protein
MKLISTTEYNKAIHCMNNANEALKVLIEKNEKLEIELEQWKAKSNINQPVVKFLLPNVDEAGVIAINVASNVEPKLTVREEAFFIAGFQECVKYLSGQFCSHPDKYFVSGVFGGYWCPKCDKNVDTDL